MKDAIRRILRERDLLNAERIEEVLEEADRTGESPDRVFLQKGYLTEADTLRLFGDVLGMEVRSSLAGIAVPPEFVQQIPVQFARSYNLVALEAHNGSMKVATCAPFETTTSGKSVSATKLASNPALTAASCSCVPFSFGLDLIHASSSVTFAGSVALISICASS